MRQAISLLGGLCAGAALAATPPALAAPKATGATPAADASTAGNTGASASAAAGGNAPASAAACAACHGAHGEGNAAAGYPRLAGQAEQYLARQLTAYANGTRVNAVMQPLAKSLTPQQIGEVSSWFASQNPAAANDRSGQSAAKGQAAGDSKRGERIATVGDESRAVQACANCHGPGGSGEPPIYPALAGQHARYLAAAMAEWKNGNRKTDGSQQMPAIAHRLSDADVAAVTAWFAAQPAPPPASARMMPPERTATHASGQASSASAGGAPSRSTPVAGTEQGAPTQGGSQGAGGFEPGKGTPGR